MTTRLSTTHASATRSAGFSLSELLVALAINAMVVTGALTVYQQQGQQYRFLQAVAELEERTTFAMRALTDSTHPAGFFHRVAGSPPVIPATATCNGNNVSAWALAMTPAIEIATAGALPCRTLGRAVNGSDVLITRFLNTLPASSEQQAHAWYVDTRSSEPGLPSLRRQTLLADGRVQNQEIMPGVERLRVTAAVDSDGDGLGDAIHSGPLQGALAVWLEITVRSNNDDVPARIARRLMTLRNE